MCMDNRDQLIVDNMKLVYFALHKYYPKRFAYDEDLIQCGMIGLCEAADKYDPEMGAFTTFAIRGIRNRISYELKLRRKHVGQVSLSQPISGDAENDLTLEDVLPGDEDVEFIDIETMLSILSPREREVAELRLSGLNGKEISKQIGCSHETPRQVCQRIKKKWRKYI